jgi:hypothetical protein
MVEWIAVEGTSDDDSNDSLWLMPASHLDLSVLPGPLSQARREDMQTWSFLLATSLSEEEHPLGVQPGNDPPDRVLTGPEGSWALELTVLTVPEFRADLARARTAGRQLEEALRANADRYEHLKGRVVAVSPASPLEPLPRDALESLPAILGALSDDRGYVGEGVDLSQGFPKVWPNRRGFYGQHGPFHVQVNGGGRVDEITVSSSAQASIRRSEAVDALAKRIEAKDRPENELLLITCGLPDEWGYLCALDSLLFAQLLGDAQEVRNSLPEPEHLNAVVMHEWNGPKWTELYRAPGKSVPWSS